MSKTKAVQFLGFLQVHPNYEGEPVEDTLEPTGMDFADLRFDREPQWLKEIFERGDRFKVDPVRKMLVYHAPGGDCFPVEQNAWLIARGDAVFRVVDAATFEAVKAAVS